MMNLTSALITDLQMSELKPVHSNHIPNLLGHSQRNSEAISLAAQSETDLPALQVANSDHRTSRPI